MHPLGKMQLRIVASSLLVFLVHCGKASQSAQRRDLPSRELSKAEKAFYAGLNQSHNDLLEALKTANYGGGHLVDPNEKVTYMKGKIEAGCAAKSTTFDDWTVDQSITQDPNKKDPCPLELSNSHTYSGAGQPWSAGITFNVTSDGFKTQYPQQILTLKMTGTITHVPAKGQAAEGIRGTFDSQAFTIQGVGDLLLHYDIDHSISAGVQRGNVTATIAFPGHWWHYMSIQYAKNGDYTYSVNGVSYSQKDFNDLFGFLQLDKIMAMSRVLK